MPVRYCKNGDGQETLPRKQRCYECDLAAQPPVVRARIAQERLALIPERYRIAKIPKQRWPEGRRWCAGCQTFVRLQDAGATRCKACASIAAHKSKAKSRFGIDDATYQWLLDLQKGRCAICRQTPKTVRLAIDHAHDCEVCGGKDGCPECVRGLLCSRCNRELLGAAHDSLHILRNAVSYMERPPMQGEWEIPAFEREEYAKAYPNEEPDPPSF